MSDAPWIDASACTNCGTSLAGRYCATCGQKVAPLAPTLGYFVHELTHELLHVDGKIFRSLRLLLTRPGFLTREIFAGRRASYVSPIRLYLIASILSFAISGLLGRYEESVNFWSTPDPGETVDPAVLNRVSEVELTISTALNVWLPRAMFVLVPLFAALVMWRRRRSGHTYPQHLYFALHVHAAWFFALAVSSVLQAALVRLRYAAPTADILAELYMVGYFFVAFKRVYETTIWGTLWRTVLVGSLYLVALLLTLVAIAAPTMLPLFFRSSP
jgi:hypothetical protein